MSGKTFIVKHGVKVNADLVDRLVPVSSLTINPKNGRAHSKRSLETVGRSLDRFGFQAPIVYDAKTRVVIAGNGRMQAARDLLGWTHVPAVPFAGTRAQVEAFALIDNRSAELSSWDWENIAGLAGIIAEGGFTFEELGFLDHEISVPLSADWTPDPPSEGQPNDATPDGLRVTFSIRQAEIVRAAIARHRASTGQSDAEILVEICERAVEVER